MTRAAFRRLRDSIARQVACSEPWCVRPYHKKGPHKNQVGEVFVTPKEKP